MSWLEAQCCNQYFQITTSCCDGLSNSTCNICIWHHAIRPSLFAIQMLLHRCHERHSSQQQLLFVGRCFMLHWKKAFYIWSVLYFLSLLLPLVRCSFKTLLHVSRTVGEGCNLMFVLGSLMEHCPEHCQRQTLRLSLYVAFPFEASGWFKFQILHT